MEETLLLQSKKRAEKKFSKEIHKQLECDFKAPYEVYEGKSLLYKLIVNPDGELKPNNYQDPKRGQYAFQSDISVWKKVGDKRIPLVVLELKFGGFSTHDILTYSAKALRHKEIYPYLRYGLVVGKKETIDRKFFIHNVGFDFAIMVGEYQLGKTALTDLVKRQVEFSETLTGLVENDGRTTRIYETKIYLSEK